MSSEDTSAVFNGEKYSITAHLDSVVVFYQNLMRQILSVQERSKD